MKKSIPLLTLLAALAVTVSTLPGAAYGAASVPAPAATTTTATETTAATAPAATTTAPDKAPVAASVGTPGTGPAFKINLSPPTKVGQKSSYVYDQTNSQRVDALVTIPGAAPMNQPTSQATVIHLEGDAEVLAVLPNGGVQKVTVTVKVLTATQDGAAMPGLPAAGAIIVGEVVGSTKTVTIDDKPAGATLTQLLGEALGLDDPKHTDQEIFGPKDPVAVGATWPANTTLLIEGLKEETHSEASGVNGVMKLDAVQGTGDDQVVSVSANYNVEGFKPPVPPIISIDSATLKVTIIGSIPATTTKGLRKTTEIQAISFTGGGVVPGGAMSVNGTIEEKASVEVTFH